MQMIEIRLRTTENKINAIRRFARLIGADFKIEEPTDVSLGQVIQEAEEEFAQGKVVTLSLQELRELAR